MKLDFFRLFVCPEFARLKLAGTRTDDPAFFYFRIRQSEE